MTAKMTSAVSTNSTVEDREELQPATAPAKAPITDALLAIARDSRANPEQYLEDTVTPYGGE